MTDKTILKTNIIGAMAAFWCSFTLLGANQLVAERTSEGLVAIPILSFYGTGMFTTIAAGLIARLTSRKITIFIGLFIMALSTIAILFTSNIKLIVLEYMLMAIGYHPVLSTTANLNWDLLPQNATYQRRGRNFFGCLSYMMAGLAPAAILLIHAGYTMVWFILSLSATAIAAIINWTVNHPKALKVQTWEVDKSKIPFFQQLIDWKTLRVTWPYGIAILCSIMTTMWLVFYIGVWASFVLFCGGMANAFSGPLMVFLAEKADHLDEQKKHRGDQIVSLCALIALIVAMLCMQTGNVPLCTIGSILIGISLCAGNFSFSQLGSAQSRLPGRGVYTHYFVIIGGQFVGSIVGMLGYGRIIYILPIPAIIVAITIFLKDLKSMDSMENS